MNQRILILIVSLWLFKIAPLSAQVGFALPFINDAYPGQVMNLPVTVSNFDSIISAQFVIRWDPTVLQYLTVGTFGLPELDAANFGYANTLDSGILRFAWNTTDTFGVNLADGETIFRLKFKVVGPLLSGTGVIFTEAPPLTFFEVTQRGGFSYGFMETDDAPPLLEQGYVAVGYTVSANEPQAPAPWRVQVFPNPFSDRTQVIFDLDQAAPIQLVLTDVAGRILLEKVVDAPSGRTGMDIDRAMLREKGLYFLTARTADFSRVYPVILH